MKSVSHSFEASTARGTGYRRSKRYFCTLTAETGPQAYDLTFISHGAGSTATVSVSRVSPNSFYKPWALSDHSSSRSDAGSSISSWWLRAVAAHPTGQIFIECSFSALEKAELPLSHRLFQSRRCGALCPSIAQVRRLACGFLCRFCRQCSLYRLLDHLLSFATGWDTLMSRRCRFIRTPVLLT
jgi:hypothetical protein